MQINHTIFEKKHRYMSIMREIEILKRQMEYEALEDEIPKERLMETCKIRDFTFVGLLREGLKYQYVQNADIPEKDIIRLTIDDVDFDCSAVTVKKMLKEEFEKLIPESKTRLQHIPISNKGNKEMPSASPINSEFTGSHSAEENFIDEKEDNANKNKTDLEFLAFHDPLTELKNRQAYSIAFEKASRKEMCFISIDVNDLKKTNDTLGHKYGNTLLIGIAKCLTDVFGDDVYRVGGDEFTVLLDGIGQEMVERKLSKFMELCETMASKNEDGIKFSAAYGYAIGDGIKTKEELADIADAQMYAKKEEMKKQQAKEIANNTNDFIENEVSEDIEELYATVVEEQDFSDLSNEFTKRRGTFIYDSYKLTVAMEGSTRGEDFDVIIAPLYLYHDNVKPEIAVWIKHGSDYAVGVSDKDKRSVKIDIAGHSFLFRGVFKHGIFESHIHAAGLTLQAGYILREKKETLRPEEGTLVKQGHIYYKKDNNIFHIIPLFDINENNGNAKCLTIIEKDDKKFAIVLPDSQGKINTILNEPYRIYNYWEKDMLVSEIVDSNTEMSQTAKKKRNKFEFDKFSNIVLLALTRIVKVVLIIGLIAFCFFGVQKLKNNPETFSDFLENVVSTESTTTEAQNTEITEELK